MQHSSHILNAKFSEPKKNKEENDEEKGAESNSRTEKKEANRRKVMKKTGRWESRIPLVDTWQRYRSGCHQSYKVFLDDTMIHDIDTGAADGNMDITPHTVTSTQSPSPDLVIFGGRRSPAVACWASDHWVGSSNPIRG